MVEEFRGIEIVLDRIKTENDFRFDKELTEFLQEIGYKINDYDIGNWRRRNEFPRRIAKQMKADDRFKKYFGENLKNDQVEINPDTTITDKEIELKEGKDMNRVDASYIIDLQRDKIAQMEKEMITLKHMLEQQPIQKMKFDEVEADMRTTVEMKNIFSLKPISRKIYNVEGVEALAKKLDMPSNVILNQYFSENNWHVTDEHPVDELIDKKSLAELKQMTKSLPTILDSLKWVAGLHYMVTPVRYVYNDNSCNTLCYILLDWKSKPVKILSKTIIINGDS